MISAMSRRGSIYVMISLVLVPAASGGCLHHQLEFTARRTLNTLPDLQYQQVMDNLAATVSNPGRLPYLAVVGQGAIQVTDTATTTLAMGDPLRSSMAGRHGIGRVAQRHGYVQPRHDHVSRKDSRNAGALPANRRPGPATSPRLSLAQCRHEPRCSAGRAPLRTARRGLCLGHARGSQRLIRVDAGHSGHCHARKLARFRSHQERSESRCRTPP